MMLLVDLNRRGDSLGRQEFVEPVRSLVGACEVRHYLEVTGLEGYDKAVLCGTPLMDSEYMEHLDAFEWVRRCDKPVLGICAGMQAMAAVYGSEVYIRREIGMTEVSTKAENPLFSGSFRAYCLHSLAVRPSGDFEILAESKDCVEAVKHRDKQLYGVLFHPEARNPDVLWRFVSLPVSVEAEP